VLGLGVVLLAAALPAGASSHREAPLISQDPNADNTDVYAFVSPDRPDTVTMVANYIPLEEPAGGSNFAAFGDIYTDDTLAWAWYRNGRTTEAARATHRALRLGTEDAMLHYHAGMIAAAPGRARIARRHLRHALAQMGRS